MTKHEFISILRRRCNNLDPNELEEAIAYYEEMINERIEHGEKEEDIIKSFGNMDDIVKDLYANIPFKKIIQRRFKVEGSSGWKVLIGFFMIPFLILFIPIIVVGSIVFAFAAVGLVFAALFLMLYFSFRFLGHLITFNFIKALYDFGIILIAIGLLGFGSKVHIRKRRRISIISRIKQNMTGRRF